MTDTPFIRAFLGLDEPLEPDHEITLEGKTELFTGIVRLFDGAINRDEGEEKECEKMSHDYSDLHTFQGSNTPKKREIL